MAGARHPGAGSRARQMYQPRELSLSVLTFRAQRSARAKRARAKCKILSPYLNKTVGPDRQRPGAVGLSERRAAGVSWQPLELSAPLSSSYSLSFYHWQASWALCATAIASAVASLWRAGFAFCGFCAKLLLTFVACAGQNLMASDESNTTNERAFGLANGPMARGGSRHGGACQRASWLARAARDEP